MRRVQLRHALRPFQSVLGPLIRGDPQKAFETPILSAFGAVAERIASRHPDVNKIGLLATSCTISGGKFEARLLQSGINTMTPGAEDQEKVKDAIY